jgi:hypothetical protein
LRNAAVQGIICDNARHGSGVKILCERVTVMPARFPSGSGGMSQVFVGEEMQAASSE